MMRVPAGGAMMRVPAGGAMMRAEQPATTPAGEGGR